MLRPDPEVNNAGESAWFGVVSWIQPGSEVRGRKAQQVRLLPEQSLTDFPFSQHHLYSVRYGGCTPASTSSTSSRPVTRRRRKSKFGSALHYRQNLRGEQIVAGAQDLLEEASMGFGPLL